MPSTWKTSSDNWNRNGRLAKANRAAMSFPEVVLWQRLRDHQMNGVKFRRQHSIGPYIVDFYCKELQLIIEVDGWSHDLQVEYDDTREKFLEMHNLKVHHIQVDRVLNDLNDVVSELEQLIEGIQQERI